MHKRIKSENGKPLETIENNETIEKGLKGGCSGCNKMEDSVPTLWIEASRKTLEERRAKIQNEEN